MSQMQAAKDSASRLRPRRKMRDAAATRRALEQSILYSEELDINLAQKTEDVYFRWFLASLLFGARISETTAKNTFRAFMHYGLTTPGKIVATGWDFLVYPVMREGGYVRYDGRKSTQILRSCESLMAGYGSSLGRLHQAASDANDLEKRLLGFYGVGPVTMNIFLRELRPFWPKADPDPLPAVKMAANQLGIDLKHYPRKSLVFARVEAGLIRRRREFARARLRGPASHPASHRPSAQGAGA